MAAAALGAISGPMKDIPVAVLRQTRLDPTDMGAAMRAYMAMANAGALAAMLAAPSLVAGLGVPTVLALCSLVFLVTGVAGLWRFAGWVEPDVLEPAG
jgi:hypothetical protein